MYEDARNLLFTRDSDNQNDAAILYELEDCTISPADAWLKLARLKSGNIRYAATKDFLTDLLGQGELGLAGDTRIIFQMEQMTILLPKNPEQDSENSKIYVELKGLENPHTDLIRPDTASSVNNDMWKKQYIQLLEEDAPIPTLVRARVKEAVEDNWGNCECWLYYIFVLWPQDIFHGRGKGKGIARWKTELWNEEREQGMENSRALAAWARCRNAALSFQRHVYPQLEQLEIPVYVGDKQNPMSVETLFHLIM